MSNAPNDDDHSRKKGIKLLMSLKNAQNVYDNYTGNSIEDYYEYLHKNDEFLESLKNEIENDELEFKNKSDDVDLIEKQSQDMLSDVDTMLQGIKELRAQIKDFKLADKVKSKMDYLKFMNNLHININTEGNQEKKNPAKSQDMFFQNKIKKDNDKNDEIQKLSDYKKYLIPKENDEDKKYKDIKEKLKKQEKQIEVMGNNIEKLKIKDEKENDDGLTGDENVDKLFREIKLANLQMDSYLRDIDDCLEMNENIEKCLDNDDDQDVKNIIMEKYGDKKEEISDVEDKKCNEKEDTKKEEKEDEKEIDKDKKEDEKEEKKEDKKEDEKEGEKEKNKQ